MRIRYCNSSLRPAFMSFFDFPLCHHTPRTERNMSRFLVIDSDGPAALDTLCSRQLHLLISQTTTVESPCDAIVADACLADGVLSRGPAALGDERQVTRFRAPNFPALATRLVRQ
jgi:hypothetical protein